MGNVNDDDREHDAELREAKQLAELVRRVRREIVDGFAALTREQLKAREQFIAVTLERLAQIAPVLALELSGKPPAKPRRR